MSERKHKQDICDRLGRVLVETDRCKELYQMTYIESQNCVVAYYYGRKIVRIWLDDQDDDFEMIERIIKVLGRE